MLAALVVVDHSFPISGLHGGSDPLWSWSRGQDSLGGVAVTGFFVISGFLVTRSWFSSASTGRYMWRRFIRIFPGFWACLLVTALCWRHWRGTTSAGAGRATSTCRTRRRPVSRAQQPLAHAPVEHRRTARRNAFAHSGYPIGWDGSLWTLIYEFKCYLLIAVLGIVGILTRHRAVVLGLLVGAYVFMLSWQVDPAWAERVLPAFRDPFVARFAFVFLLGSACALYAERVEINDRLGIVAAAVLLMTLHWGGYLLLGYPALAYLCLYLAVRLPITNFDRYGDFSYGTYIYAFPIQQLLALYGMQRHGIWAFIVASLAVATAAAFVSWHVVEKPAMKLKNWTPPRFRRRQAVHALRRKDPWQRRFL